MPQLPLLPHVDFLAVSLHSTKPLQCSPSLPPPQHTLLPALVQAELHMGCASHQGRAGPAAWAPKFTLCLGRRVILAAVCAACGCIKETSSKAEEPNQAVKPNFCNYVQQLHRNQCLFMSGDWLKARFITTFQSFHTLANNLKALREQTLTISLWKVKTKGNWQLRQ